MAADHFRQPFLFYTNRRSDCFYAISENTLYYRLSKSVIIKGLLAFISSSTFFTSS